MNLRYITLLLLVTILPLHAQQRTAIEEGESVDGTLAAEARHVYVLEVDENAFVHGVVEQRTVDVVVELYDPDGSTLGRFDGPGRGAEHFQAETKSAGLLRIEITPFKHASGAYTLLVDRVEDVAEDPEDRVAQLLAAWEGAATPGYGVAVYKDGEVLAMRTGGMADLTHGLPFTRETACNIGSVSKQFTAFGIAMLAAEGKLSLDDDIRRYFPELPAFSDTTRIRHLLTHTGGYREVYNTMPLTGWDFEDALSREDVLDMVCRQQKLQSVPGAAYRYNNTAFILLGLLVERVTGRNFAEWMREQVFTPLGMAQTRYRAVRGEVIPNAAFGYALGADGRYVAAGDFDASAGAGGVHITLDDAGRWVHNFSTKRVGAEALRTITTKAVLASGDTVDYGCGIGVTTYRGLTTYAHGGADLAHRAQVVIFPDIDAGVMLMSNNAGFPAEMAYKIADMFFGEYMTPLPKPETEEAGATAAAVDTAAFDRAAGRYRFRDVPLNIEYTREGTALYAQATGQPRVELRAVSDSVYEYVGVPGARVTFHLPAEGRADSATHFQGRNLSLTRAVDYAPDSAALAEFTGMYYSEELDAVLHCAFKADTLRLARARMEDVPLKPVKPDSFNGSRLFDDVRFERDAEGRITAFTVSNARTLIVRFRKMR